ncbi:MAG: hypothetical protein ACLSVD_18855 [Eggerthellaceae bacterium]
MGITGGRVCSFARSPLGDRSRSRCADTSCRCAEQAESILIG